MAKDEANNESPNEQKTGFKDIGEHPFPKITSSNSDMAPSIVIAADQDEVVIHGGNSALVQHAVSDLVAASPQIGITNSTIPTLQAAPTLLGLPLEIRNQIYGYFMTIDRSTEYCPSLKRWQNNFNLNFLRVNRQLRAEAWEILRKTNLWIRLTVVTETGASVKPDFRDGNSFRGRAVQPWLQSQEFPAADMDLLKSGTALHIWIGETCGTDDGAESEMPCSHSELLFAYSKTSYSFFCNELFAKLPEYHNISIDVNPVLLSASSKYIMKELVTPLTIIRGATRAVFRRLSGRKAFRRLQNIMKTPVRTQSDIHEILMSFKDAGNVAFQEKNYSLAIHLYNRGVIAFGPLTEIAKAQNLPVGVPESNEIYHVVGDIHSNYSLAVNKLVETRRLGNDRRIANVTHIQLQDAAISAAAALGWPGLLDDQRVKAHFRRAVAHENLADWLKQQDQKENLIASRLIESQVMKIYDAAGKDYFYAMQAFGKTKGSDYEMMRQGYERARGKSGPLGCSGTTDENTGFLMGDMDYKQGYEVDEMQLPGGIVWKGDPRLVARWGTQMMGMAILRLRLPK